jgi:Xaa-Pro aminopeptidase
MSRADRLVELLRERELDALLVTNLVNVRYLTGFTGTNGACVVTPDERLFLTDSRYTELAKRQVGDFELLEASQALLSDLAARLGGRAGFDDADLSVKAHAKLASEVPAEVELVAAGGLVEQLRAIKEPGEVDALRAATKIADLAYSELQSVGLLGRTEREVARSIVRFLEDNGADEVSFPPIVAAADNGALPHAVPRDVEIPAGALVVIDLGARLDGYCSDCTRTFATGPLSERQVEAYEAVHVAQRLALDEIRAGTPCKEVDADAREVIESRLGITFEHGLGHGVGLEVHEGPRLARTAEGSLEAGNAVTVEPGVYAPGEFGIRIEDLVIVTESSCDILTGFPKELVTVN